MSDRTNQCALGRLTRRRLTVAISLALGSTLPTFAQGQTGEEARQLSKVAVQADADVDTGIKVDKASSPKLTQPLLDTPQTITVVSAEVLQQQGTRTLVEALRNTPGITMQLGENGNTSAGDSFSMRGFSTQSSIFVDGIRDLGAVTRDTFNISQVEIAKGPAGADIGRGATTGYVNLVTKVPTAESFAAADLSWDTENFKRITADANMALGEHNALRLNVVGHDGGVPGRDYINNKSWGVAPSFVTGLGSDTRVYVYGQHVQQDNTPDGGVPTIGLPDYYHSAFASGGVHAGTSPAAVDSENYYGQTHDFEKVRADMITVRIEHEISDSVTLRNSSRYGKSSMERILTGIGVTTDATYTNGLNLASPDSEQWTVLRSRQSTFQDNKILTNQTNLTAEFATGALRHSLSTGFEISDEQQYTPTYTGIGALPAANLYHPNRDAAYTDIYDPRPNGAFSRGDTTTVAAYAFDTLKFNEQWQVDAGVRYERYNTDSNSVALSTLAAQPTLPVGTLVPTALSKDDNLLSWKVGAVFKPVPNGTIYAAFANSSTPPGSANFTLSATNTNINSPSLDPQITTNIEIGTKWDLFDARLGLTLAAYRSENKNSIAVLDASTNTVAQFGKQRVEGVELGIVGNLTNAWQIIGGVAYMDTEVVDGSTGNNAQGATLRWSPPLTATLWTTYRLPHGILIGGGARYVDRQDRIVDPSVSSTTTFGVPNIPSYWVADAMVSYDVTKHVGLQLNVNNLFDKSYINTLNNNSGARYTPGAPRYAQLTARFKF